MWYELRLNRRGHLQHLQVVRYWSMAKELSRSYGWHNLEIVDHETKEVLWRGNDGHEVGQRETRDGIPEDYKRSLENEEK